MWPSSNQGKWNNAFSVSLCARASQVRVMLDAKQPDPELLSMERRVSGEGDSTLGAAALFGLLASFSQRRLPALPTRQSLDSDSDFSDDEARSTNDPPLTLLRLSEHLDALRSPIHPSSACAGVKQYNALVRSVPNPPDAIREDETSWSRYLKEDQDKNNAVIFVVKAPDNDEEIIQCLTLTVKPEDTSIQVADVVTRKEDTWSGRKLRRRGLLRLSLGVCRDAPRLALCASTYECLYLRFSFCLSRCSLRRCGRGDFTGDHIPSDVPARARARVQPPRLLARGAERAGRRAVSASAMPRGVGALRRGGAHAPQSCQRRRVLRQAAQAVRRVRRALDGRRRSKRAAPPL